MPDPLSENQWASDLRRTAEEIRADGHDGWGNACACGADEIDRLRADNEVLVAALQAIEVEVHLKNIRQIATRTLERPSRRHLYG